MNTLYGWVDPGFLQGMLVSIGMLAVAAVALVVILTLIANDNVAIGFIALAPVGLAYLYLVVAQAYAIYLIINNGVTGWDWLLLVLYALSIFNGGSSVPASRNS